MIFYSLLSALKRTGRRNIKLKLMQKGWLVSAMLSFMLQFQTSIAFATQPHAALEDKDDAWIKAHGFALHGDLKYAAGFTHFDYVRPDAPKGGFLRLLGFGTFDSLNPYTLKGTSPFNTPGQFMYGFSELNETLLAGTGSYLPAGDEPQSAYGLLAESLRYPVDLSRVIFTLRPNIRFHDGHILDAKDVSFSYKTLLEHGHPRFQQQLLGIESVTALSDREVEVKFKPPFRGSNILRIGEMPVLPEHYWRDKDFASSSQTPPLLSGPYKLGNYAIGKFIELERVDNFWAKDLNIYRGRFNFDRVRIDYYRDQTVAFESFKARELDIYYDYTAKNWATGYDIPAIEHGDMIKEEIAHKIPSGTQGFFFNTRKDLFADLRVRQALSLLFDFEWTNKTLFNGAYRRNLSIYPNSEFSATGLPSQQEISLLEPYREHLPDELFTQAFTLPVSDGNGNIRPQTRHALGLLKAAGWEIEGGKLTHRQSGKRFTFEILIRQAGIQRVVLPYIKNLEKVGIVAEARLVDTTQYKHRMDHYDFDMTTYVLSQGMSPSYEQRDYFHSSQVKVVGGQNYAGVSHPAVDGLLEKVIDAPDRPSLVSAMRALDRVLLWHHYLVPNWHLNYHRLAYWNRFGRPEKQAPFTLGTENWWALPKPSEVSP